MPLTRREILLGGAAICVPGAATAALGLRWTGRHITGFFPPASAAESTLPDTLMETIFERGGWSASADDNVQGETLKADFVKGLMLDYRDKPQERSAQSGLGVLALTLSVAQWGIDDPAGLPQDPAQSGWKAQTGSNSGKHLMSYGVGGVGIAHLDQGDLLAFMRHVLEAGIVPDEHRAAFARLTVPSLYPAAQGGVYGQLRAAGECAPLAIDVDLEGAVFKHFKNSHNVGYCQKYKNPSLTSLDWQTFRTCIRAALRTKEGQRWVFRLWLEKYWDRSLARVPPGEGATEELLINVRIRNSLPACADKAVLAPAVDANGRVKRELDEYAKCAPSAYERRRALMLRPVVLYRHFTGAPPLGMTQ
jgi:hypothetical protein